MSVDDHQRKFAQRPEELVWVDGTYLNPNLPDKQSVTSAFTSPEDVSYMLKLGGGSVAGAVAIKYGSILFPELARPNLTQALIMICTPMLVSVFLLIKQSSAAVKQNDDNS
ncbi:hypothetical protein ACHQM5_002573 [Ranunculus cassubicifolius]